MLLFIFLLLKVVDNCVASTFLYVGCALLRYIITFVRLSFVLLSL